MNAARTLRILMAMERNGDGYFRAVMRGQHGDVPKHEKGLAQMLTFELRDQSGDPTITLEEFYTMCASVRRQAACN